MEWRFKDRTEGETRTETNLDEFFLPENDTFKNFAVSLVREDVQNRLDAKNPELEAEVPVKVRYFLSTSGDDSERKIDKEDNWLKFTGKLIDLKDLTDETSEYDRQHYLDEAVKAFCELHDILAIDNETEVAE